MTKELRIDKRGRVRFAAQGHRFEVNKNGLKIYRRENSDFFGKPQEYDVTYTFNVSRIKNPTLLLIAEAVMLVNGKLGSAELVNTNA